MLVANYNDMPNHNRLLTRQEAAQRGLKTIVEKAEEGPNDKGEASAEGAGDPQAGSPYAIDGTPACCARSRLMAGSARST